MHFVLSNSIGHVGLENWFEQHWRENGEMANFVFDSGVAGNEVFECLLIAGLDEVPCFWNVFGLRYGENGSRGGFHGCARLDLGAHGEV